MAGLFGTIPNNTSIPAGGTVRRKLTDDGWEGYHLVTAEEMAAKADLSDGVVPTSQLPPLLTLGESSSTAYRGDRGKEAYDHSQITSGNPHGVTQADVGLGNVNNTSDADKPISTATQAALNLKADIASLGETAFSNDYNDLLNKPTIPTMPTLRRQEPYVGTTNSSGNYTVTYTTPYAQAPLVNVELQGAAANQWARVTSSTTTGFTVQAVQRNTINLLGSEVLLGSTGPLSGATVAVLVTER